MLDYQERPEANTEKRWLDRLTLDGSWSGNLYDFYRKVYPKLVEGLKIPFELEGDQRRDESPAHVALREALCNVLVHADFSDRCSVLVIKRPDLFGFRNPGLMRVPIEFALQGGHPDCRNRTLHQMFRYVGIGDQAGSGLPKILSGWHSYHWRPPELREEHEPYDQTLLTMRMIDLFPPELVERLQERFGQIYDSLPHMDRVGLAIAEVEGVVSHQRLCSVGNAHPADASQCLRQLVEKQFLQKRDQAEGPFTTSEESPFPALKMCSTPRFWKQTPRLRSRAPRLRSRAPRLKNVTIPVFSRLKRTRFHLLII